MALTKTTWNMVGVETPILPSNENFQNDGAVINRLNDKLFIGGATASDGSLPNVDKDWLSTYQETLNLYNVIGTVNTGVTTLGSPIITFTAGTFAPIAGKPIYGTGIPNGATISTIDSSTQITMSANAIQTTTKNTFYSGTSTYLSGTGLYSNTFGLTNESTDCTCGALFGAENSEITRDGPSTIGVFGYAISNNDTYAGGAWGGYFECHLNDTKNGARGVEIDVRATRQSNKSYPYSQSITSTLQLAAGCGIANPNQYNIGAAIQILANPNKFITGIQFGNNSLEGTDGTSGNATAIAMAPFQSIEWFNSSNLLTARISCSNTNQANKTELIFSSLGIQILGSTNSALLYVFDVPNAVNQLQLIPSVTGNPAILSATGTDTDVDLFLACKNSGVVRFGTFTGTGDVACNGYITIKDQAGNIRKLMTTA